MKTNRRHFLLTYTNVNGEREFDGHSVLSISAHASIKKAVHDHFLDFWGDDSSDKEDDVVGTYYTYWGSELAVRNIGWMKITDEQATTLSALGL